MNNPGRVAQTCVELRRDQCGPHDLQHSGQVRKANVRKGRQEPRESHARITVQTGKVHQERTRFFQKGKRDGGQRSVECASGFREDAKKPAPSNLCHRRHLVWKPTKRLIVKTKAKSLNTTSHQTTEKRTGSPRNKPTRETNHPRTLPAEGKKFKKRNRHSGGRRENQNGEPGQRVFSVAKKRPDRTCGVTGGTEK